MRYRLPATIVTLVAIGGSAAASPRPRLPHLPPRPNTTSLLAAAPIAPNGTLIRDGERLRTLELDELAPLRLRISIPF